MLGAERPEMDLVTENLTLVFLRRHHLSLSTKARIFLLVDLREFVFRFGVEGTKKKICKKALKMTS